MISAGREEIKYQELLTTHIIKEYQQSLWLSMVIDSYNMPSLERPSLLVQQLERYYIWVYAINFVPFSQLEWFFCCHSIVFEQFNKISVNNRYTFFIGDGDSSIYSSLIESVPWGWHHCQMMIHNTGGIYGTQHVALQAYRKSGNMLGTEPRTGHCWTTHTVESTA